MLAITVWAMKMLALSRAIGIANSLEGSKVVNCVCVCVCVRGGCGCLWYLYGPDVRWNGSRQVGWKCVVKYVNM